ncbi:MAG: T9SS C-terminal target domain-containing protein [Calditrichaeota bacterium]|nr:MAG: T9SS C-terminal target domain-containing protein [Calditrichota bacterium]MBL1204132.1 T9SS C-terminal target domain-containing protein [Calditrichota bacterium]NOG43963.1 T9SS type A sorting domain-containing protein [Calditrichota bacterium]
MKTYLFSILILVVSNSQAQYSHTFTLAAHANIEVENDGYIGRGRDVAVGLDGTVFLAVGSEGSILGSILGTFGLSAYSFNGSSLINTAYAPIDSGQAFDVAVGPDGIVFLASSKSGGHHGEPGDDGLRSFIYQDTTFTNTAHIDDNGSARSVIVGPDGTVFLASSGDGLRAYSYDGDSFINTAHIYNGDDAESVAVNSNGTVFVAYGDSGLYAYRYDDTSFTNIGHINDEGWANGVVVGQGGTIFLANGEDGLRAYNFDGVSFTNTAHVNNVDEKGFAHDVTIGLEGTVFLTGGDDGLRAYDYNGTSFTNTAHIYDSTGSAHGVAVGPDGTIFLANWEGGLVAYTYSPISGFADKLLRSPIQFVLSHNYPNPFNPSTTIKYQLPKTSKVDLSIYNLLGQKVISLVNKKQQSGQYAIEWDASGFSTGVYYYQLKTDRGYIKTRKLILLK